MTSTFHPPLPLIKSHHPSDLVLLEPDLHEVDQVPMSTDQHPLRRWEYAMCLLAIRTWSAWCEPTPPICALDVGGAGSPLPDLLRNVGLHPKVIDPTVNFTLERYEGPQCPVVCCISTIEHVPDEDMKKFVDTLASVVSANGLLFLTTDVWDKRGKDTAHFHWMRERIYTMTSAGSWCSLTQSMIARGFYFLGPVADWHYHGDYVYDYSFASMALVKAPGEAR